MKILTTALVFLILLMPLNVEAKEKYKDYEYVGMDMPSRALTDKIVEMGRKEFPNADIIIPTISLTKDSDTESDYVDGIFTVYAYNVDGNTMVLENTMDFSGRMYFGYDKNGFCVVKFSKKDVVASKTDVNDNLLDYMLNTNCEFDFDTYEESHSASMSQE